MRTMIKVAVGLAALLALQLGASWVSGATPGLEPSQ